MIKLSLGHKQVLNKVLTKLLFYEPPYIYYNSLL